MPAARNWVATLPSGSMRDSALSGVIEAFDDGAPDARILSLFSSDLVLQEALVDAIARIGPRDQVEARRLIDEYLSDSPLRQQAEQLMLPSAQ